MSILIKGMEMPKSCDLCDFVLELNEHELGTHLYCGFPTFGEYVDDCIATRHPKCPLGVELHPHGRLIDADAFIAKEREYFCKDCDRRKGFKNGKPTKIVYEIGDAPCRACGIDDMIDCVDDAPAIIEAEGEE